LDIDSDNTDGVNPNWTPTDREDEIEFNHADTVPGKVVVPNILDDDNDRVPNFADGYSGLPRSFHAALKAALIKKANGGGGESRFVPIKIKIPDVKMNNAKLKFIYSASDPLQVSVDAKGNVQPAAGLLRIWIKKSSRNGKPFTKKGNAKGHFIPSDDPFEVGKEKAGETITLYVEGVRESNAPGTDTIKAVFAPNGDFGGAKTTDDTITLTIQKWSTTLLDFVIKEKPLVNKTKTWRKTVAQIRAIPNGTEVGSTVPKFAAAERKSRSRIGQVDRYNLQGVKETGMVVKIVELTMPYEITVTVPLWANYARQPPARQRQWDRFAAAILAHEMAHVVHVRKRFTQLDNIEQRIAAIFVKFDPTQPNAAKNAKAAATNQVNAILIGLFQAADRRLGVDIEADGDDFHDTPAGAPIDPKKYFKR